MRWNLVRNRYAPAITDCDYKYNTISPIRLCQTVIRNGRHYKGIRRKKAIMLLSVREFVVQRDARPRQDDVHIRRSVPRGLTVDTVRSIDLSRVLSAHPRAGIDDRPCRFRRREVVQGDEISPVVRC